jgi:hypothetical protein
VPIPIEDFGHPARVRRQALATDWTNLSGDVFNISVCVNGARGMRLGFLPGAPLNCLRMGGQSSNGPWLFEVYQNFDI